MPARNVETGKLEFVGQIVDVDIEIGAPDMRYIGEDYFIVLEKTEGRSFQPGLTFKKVYLNRWEPEQQPSRWEYQNSTKHKVYSEAIIDAEDCHKETYRQWQDAERLFSLTLRQYKDCTAPTIKKDVFIHKGKHKNLSGFVNKIINRHGTILEVIDMTTGESYLIPPSYCRVVLPTSYIEGSVACLDCHSIFETPKSVRWVKWEDISRPMCYLCIDYYMERDVLPMGEDITQMEGPFEYVNPLASSFINPPMR